MIASDRRGVSEALSFVLVFSIIIASVGFAYVGGYGALTDYQEGEQVSNAERALIGLKGAFDDVERGNADARAGEIRLSGGTLSVNESGSINVTVHHEEQGRDLPDFSTGTLAYEYSDTTIAYESGAVIRQQGEGGLVREAPTMQCSADRAIVSIVSLSREPDDETERIRSDGSVEVQIEKDERTSALYSWNDRGEAYDVSVAVNESAYADEWEQWFDAQDGWTATADGFECNADSVFVRETVIYVRLFS